MKEPNLDTKELVRNRSAGKRAGKILAILLISTFLLAALAAGSHFAALHYADSGNYLLTAKCVFSQKLTAMIDPELAAFAEACCSLSSGDYETACRQFSALPGYRSADQLMQESRYLQARKDFAEGDLEKSQLQFQTLGTYKDSQDWLLEVQLQNSLKSAENGDYLLSYRLLQKLSDQRDVTKELSSVRDALYQQAVELYHKGEYGPALARFRALEGYLDADKYILLASARTEIRSFMDFSDAEKIYEIRDFEDAMDVLLSGHILPVFLQGNWKNEKEGVFFNLDKDGGYYSNLFYIDYGDYFIWEDGKFKLCLDQHQRGKLSQWAFDIIDKDTIYVYCYAVNFGYTLYRQT